jgi:hypothetical protein
MLKLKKVWDTKWIDNRNIPTINAIKMIITF